MIDQETLQLYLKHTSDILMIFAPNIGFIAQIIKFRKMKTSQGFSKLLTFSIITSNILRIYFWIGKRFALALLFQSIMSAIMQLFLINECLKYSNNSITKNKKEIVIEDLKSMRSINQHKPISIMELKTFWNWPHLVDYIYVIILFSLILGFISNIIGFDNMILVESFGIASAFFEAIVAIPQIFQNCKNKNTESLSVLMIITWILGDIFKTVYFYMTKSPLQMICCGFFQITADSILITQIICYYNNTKSKIEYKVVRNKENREFEVNSRISKELTSANSDTDSSGEEFSYIV
jgi:hypothetical protein